MKSVKIWFSQDWNKSISFVIFQIACQSLDVFVLPVPIHLAVSAASTINARIPISRAFDWPPFEPPISVFTKSIFRVLLGHLDHFIYGIFLWHSRLFWNKNWKMLDELLQRFFFSFYLLNTGLLSISLGQHVVFDIKVLTWELRLDALLKLLTNGAMSGKITGVSNWSWFMQCSRDSWNSWTFGFWEDSDAPMTLWWWLWRY